MGGIEESDDYLDKFIKDEIKLSLLGDITDPIFALRGIVSITIYIEYLYSKKQKI